MKKLFTLFAAVLVALTASAKVIEITPTSPFEKDQLRQALDSASIGDTILMAEGTYVESPENYILFSKSNVVMPAEGANVIIKPQVSFRVGGGAVAEINGVVIDASDLLAVNNWYENLFEVNDALAGNSWIIKNCEIYSIPSKTLLRHASGKALDYIVIEGCYIHDNAQATLRLQDTSLKGVTIVNTTIANVANGGSFWCAPIDISKTAADAKVIVDHCTFYHNTTISSSYADVTVGYDGSATSDVTISNCIFAQPEAYSSGRAINLVNGGVVKNCLTFNYTKSTDGIQGETTRTDCITGDPMFKSAAEANFALLEGSPALTAGSDGKAIGDLRWVPAPVETQALYLKPGIWYYADNDEKFAIYSWADGKEAAWSDFMELAENETAIWTGAIPADHDHLIFVRFGNAATAPSWTDNMWNKTFDLEIVEGKDMYSITGWGEGEGAPCTGEWSKYEYIEPAKFYIAGDDKLVGEEKAWQSDGLKVMEDSYTFENLAAGNYQFKITIDGTWNTAKGFEDLTPESRDAELYLNGGNIGFTLAEAGDVTITYIKDVVFKVEGAFVLPELQLIGIKGWTAETDAIDFVPADNHLTASVTETLDEWYYEFKLIYAGSWIGKKTDKPENLYVLKNDWTSVDGLSWDGYNIALKMVEGDYVPGKYTFTWTYATGELTVTFPDTPSALDNANAAIKAIKVIRNGMLLIEKNGKTYNVLGTMVK